MVGIIARLPFAFFGEFFIETGRAGWRISCLWVEIVVWILIVIATVLLIQGHVWFNTVCKEDNR
jgi:hypothetical protein